jgi:hypothetical protein
MCVYIYILYIYIPYIYIYVYTYIHIYTHICIDINAAVSNGKRKTRQFSLTRLPFADCANGFANGLNELKGLNGLVHLCQRIYLLLNL